MDNLLFLTIYRFFISAFNTTFFALIVNCNKLNLKNLLLCSFLALCPPHRQRVQQQGHAVAALLVNELLVAAIGVAVLGLFSAGAVSNDLLPPQFS
jgi:hypothetical protein